MEDSERKSGEGNWLVTYSDLVTLLLAAPAARVIGWIEPEGITVAGAEGLALARGGQIFSTVMSSPV